MPQPFVIAAGAAPAFFTEVAALLVSSAALAYVCHRFRIMPIVSFLIAGALIGPQALGLVRDAELIDAAAEVGVILLLFTIGIEFSLERLARIKRLIFVGGGVQVGLTVGLVAGLLVLFGADWRIGIYTGFLVALSSTVIVMKLLMDRRETNTEVGQASLGILIFQDLAVVAMVLIVPMLAAESGTAWGLAWAFGKAAGIIAVVLIAARSLMPKVLEAVARTCSQEIFLLTVVAICFGTAWLTSLAGVSLSLGAFLAGLVISESRFSEMAIGEILPLQILFSATFFVSVGLLLDFGYIVREPLVILAAIGIVLLIKFLMTSLSLKVMGYSTGTAAFTGLMLAQVGEFSFVLERTGREVGLYPAGMEDGGPEAFIAATVLLMMATPALSGLGKRLRRGDGSQRRPPLGKEAVRDDAALRDHVIIAGFGPAGRRLAEKLEAEGVPYLILTLSPEGAREAEERHLRVMSGNYTRRHELSMAGIRNATMLVVADDDLETTRRVVSSARALNSDLEVIVRTRFAEETTALSEAGATSVTAEDQASIDRLLDDVLGAYRPSGRAGSRVDLTERQRNSQRCNHMEAVAAVSPGAEGCEECLEMGDTWVHLRICMTCGHVGCCDESKNKHATRHHHETGHPIIKSLEPGEDWAWCYVDEVML